LKRLTRRMVLALDADAAGAQATLRGLQVARETLDRDADLIFDARGLLRNEGRLNADIRVTTLPEGMDPDDVVNQNPDQWVQLIEAAKPIVVHVMETLAASQDINDPKAKQEITRQVMPLIQDLPSAIERDTYIQQLARLLKVDERTLLSDRRFTRVPSRIRRRRRPKPKLKDASQSGQAVQTQISQPIKSLEEYCLSIIIRLPELINRVDRSLQQSGLARVSANDFQLTDHQEILKVSIESLDQDFLEPLNFALDNLPLPLLEYADNILRQSKDLDPYEERVLNDLLRTILRLREYNLHQSNNQLRFLMQDAQEQGALLTEEYQKTINQNSLTLRNVQKALGPQMTQAFTG
ncbi:MAG: hypothetical protein E3J88_06050, partial [Anaerolineales bacterium]